MGSHERSPEVDVDIGVIYSGEHRYLEPLLASAVQSAPELCMRLILVDNASEDCLHDKPGAFDDMLCLINERRLTYAENLNQILAASTARYVLLLNTDMAFGAAELCIAKMVRFMDEHDDCGIAGCRTYDRQGNYGFPVRRYPTLPMILSRRVLANFGFRGPLKRYLYDEFSRNDTFECDWVAGCFMMVRRQAYEDVGPFDTRYRKYCEDTDYCRQMRWAGWKVYFHGATWCYHFCQGASRRWFSPPFFTHIASYVRYRRKWSKLNRSAHASR